MQKTVVVKVNRMKKHPKYLKYFKTSSRFKVHAENEKDYRIGDVVVIQETRPLSKDKRWKVVKVVRRASGAEEEGGDSEEKG